VDEFLQIVHFVLRSEGATIRALSRLNPSLFHIFFCRRCEIISLDTAPDAHSERKFSSAPAAAWAQMIAFAAVARRRSPPMAALSLACAGAVKGYRWHGDAFRQIAF
jgi:hypothetical protein